MNELQEQILALLVAKFQGVRKDGLQHLAAAIGLWKIHRKLPLQTK